MNKLVFDLIVMFSYNYEYEKFFSTRLSGFSPFRAYEYYYAGLPAYLNFVSVFL